MKPAISIPFSSLVGYFPIAWIFLLCATAQAQSPSELQTVSWTSGTNVELLSGGAVRKNAGTTNTWNAGARSTLQLLRDGRVEFKVTAGSLLAIGLNLADKSNNYYDLDHSIRLIDATHAQAYEGNNLGTASTAAGASVTYDADTVFIIRRRGSIVDYWKRAVVSGVFTDTLMHTSTVPSAGSVMVDCSFYTVDSKITSCQIYTGDLDNDGLPDAWESAYLPPDHGWNDLNAFTATGQADGDGISNLDEFLSGTSPTDELSRADAVDWLRDAAHQTNTSLSALTAGGIEKTTPGTTAAYNAKAFASKSILEDGMLTFRVTAGTITTVGLSSTMSSTASTDFEWAFVTAVDGTFDIKPNTTAVSPITSIGAYTADTLFTIQRERGQVRFLKDGVLVHSATLKSYGQLYPIVWLSSPAAKVTMARLYNGDVDGDLMTDDWELRYLPVEAGRTELDAFLPGGHADGDAWANIEEFYDGTNPLFDSGYSTNVGWVPSSTTNVQLVAGSKDGVKKIAGGSSWLNADAVGTPLMQQTGRLAFTVKAPTHHLAVGLTLANNSRSYSDLEYSVFVDPTGKAFVYEGAYNKFALGDYTSSTRFGIRRVGGEIMYFKDGTPYYVSTAALSPSASLLADNSFYTVGSEIASASLYSDDVDGDLMPDEWEIQQWLRMPSSNGVPPTFEQLRDNFLAVGDEDGDQILNREEHSAASDPLQALSKPLAVTWTNLTNTTTSGLAPGALKKTYNSAAYNADATSSQFLAADGTLIFSAATTGTLIAGFALEDDSVTNLNTDADLAYAFILTSGGACSIQRPAAEGTDLAVGTYTASTLFAIRRTGVVIEYLKDGVVMYTSTTPSTGSLYADCSILTYNHQLASARLHYFDATHDIDNDGAPDDWELTFLPVFADQTSLTNFDDSLDDDGVSLLNEYLHGTSPLLSDTDDDDMPDLWEITHGLAANNDLNRDVDADSDGLTNYQEFVHQTNPHDSDSDDDALLDGLEITNGSNPHDADTDDDQMPDGYEVTYFLNPTTADDALVDKDGDRVPNLWEFSRGTNPANAASLPAWDAVVGSTQDLAALVQALPPSNTYRYTVQLGSGIHEAANLDLSGSGTRMIAFAGQADPNSSTEVSILLGANWVLTGETVVSSVIMEGGSGIRLAPASGSPRVRLVNCLMRDIQPYRAQGTSGAVYGGAFTNQGAALTLEHCTLYRSSSWTDGGMPVATIANLSGTLKLKNSIVWDNIIVTSTPVTGAGGFISIQTSLVQGGMGGAINSSPALNAKGYLTTGSTACLMAGGGTFEPYDLLQALRPATPALGAVQSTFAHVQNGAAQGGSESSGPGGVPSYLLDTDGDDMTNAEELANGTESDEWDTDGDGFSDGQEDDAGTDPLSAASNIDTLLGLQVLSRTE